MQLAMLDGGLLLYLLLCALSVVAGLGLVRLLRLPLSVRSALILAPALTLAFWSVAFGVGVPFRIPVRYLTAPVWAATLALAAYGLWALAVASRSATPVQDHPDAAPALSPTTRSAGRRLLGEGWLLAVCAALPVIVLFPRFWEGLADHPGSNYPDEGIYVAYGQYLWSYSWDVRGGLAPIYQYAAGNEMYGMRYISASLLGFLSPLFSPGDTQAPLGLLMAWYLFVLAASCGFFGLTQELRAHLLIPYLLLSVLSGWVSNMVWANNYDNALVLACFPALAAVSLYLNPRSWPWRMVLGLFGAGMLYGEPHVALIAFAAVLPLLLYRCWQEGGDFKAWAWTLGWSLALMLLLVAPGVQFIHAFLSTIVGWVLHPQQGRPAHRLFRGLLAARNQPGAFWGLGGEWGDESLLAVRNALGLVLSALAGIGLLRLVRQRRLGVAALVALLLAGFLVFTLRVGYGYGAYKIVLLGWWAFCFIVVLGIDALTARLSVQVSAPAACVLGMLIVAAGLPFSRTADIKVYAASEYHRLNLAEFRKLRQLQEVVGDARLLVEIDDWLANERALYLLRDRAIHVRAYRMWVAGDQPAMERAQRVPFEETRFVLTDSTFDGSFRDGPHWQLIWSGGPYRLWDPESAGRAEIKSITGTAVEQSPEGPSVRLGPEELVLTVEASRPGMLRLAAHFESGPVRGECRVFVATDAGFQGALTLESGDQVISLPVRAGANQVALRAAAALGVRGMRARLVALREVAVPVAPAALHQMTWNDGVGEALGDSPSLDLALPEPQLVYAIRIKYTYLEAAGPADFGLFWKKKGRDDFSETERNACRALETGSGEKTLTVVVDDTIDHLRIRPDRKPCRFRVAEVVLLVPWSVEEQGPYQKQVRRIRELVRRVLPEGAVVAVINKGDEALLRLDGRRGEHFPQTEDGRYTGYNPANSQEVLGHLERVRAKGAQFLLVPEDYAWWLEHYKEFREHLETRYRVVIRQEELCVIFDLR